MDRSPSEKENLLVLPPGLLALQELSWLATPGELRSGPSLSASLSKYQQAHALAAAAPKDA